MGVPPVVEVGVGHLGDVPSSGYRGVFGGAPGDDEVQEVRAGWVPCQCLVQDWGEPRLRPLAEGWAVLCGRDDTVGIGVAWVVPRCGMPLF